MQNRKQLLENLISCSLPVAETLDLLERFGWDSEEALVELTRRDIVNVLNRYLDKKLTSDDVEQWANLLEGREDVDYEMMYEGVIEEAIFQLANPDLTKPINSDSAIELIFMLEKR